MPSSFLELIRVRSCVAGAVACVAGAHLTDHDLTVRPDLIAAALSVACAVAFAETTNDILDIDVDRLDKPRRPLPSGRISVSTAWVVAILSGLIGFLMALIVGHALAIFLLAVLALSWSYSRYWKSTVLLGNLAVAVIASMCITYGATAIGGGLSFQVVLAQAFALTVALALEVVKTARDATGDAAGGVRTFATRYGVRHSALLATSLCVLVVPLSAAPAVWFGAGPSYVVVASLGVMAPALLAGISLAFVYDTADLFRPLRLVRIMWGFTVISLLFA
jgi:geranylgeranylglycerol-phosphate geranylgeranyltransferase